MTYCYQDFLVAENLVAKSQFSCSEALRLDGFHVAFYHKYWDVVSTQVTLACLGVLNGGNLVEVVNATNIVLIPKKKVPVRLVEYRPISLCNII